jgi:hypothetical protein
MPLREGMRASYLLDEKRKAEKNVSGKDLELTVSINKKRCSHPAKRCIQRCNLWKPGVYSHRHNVSIDLAGTKNANATKDDMRAHILLEKKEHKKNSLKRSGIGSQYIKRK